MKPYYCREVPSKDFIVKVTLHIPVSAFNEDEAKTFIKEELKDNCKNIKKIEAKEY